MNKKKKEVQDKTAGEEQLETYYDNFYLFYVCAMG